MTNKEPGTTIANMVKSLRANQEKEQLRSNKLFHHTLALPKYEYTQHEVD